MTFTLSCIVVGALLIAITLTSSLLKRLPLNTTILYLGVGFGNGPTGLGLIQLDPVKDSVLLERVTEVSVIVSLFATGLKLRTHLSEVSHGLVWHSRYRRHLLFDVCDQSRSSPGSGSAVNSPDLNNRGCVHRSTRYIGDVADEFLRA